MQNHHVRLVEEDELPLGTEWALVEVDGQMILFTTAAAMRPDAMEEMWAAYRLLISPPQPPVPRRTTVVPQASWLATLEMA